MDDYRYHHVVQRMEPHRTVIYQRPLVGIAGLLVVVGLIATGLSLFSWVTLQWAGTPWFPMTCAVVGLAAGTVGARMAVSQVRKSPATPAPRRSGWRSWLRPMPALGAVGIALGCLAVVTQVASASIPRDAPADDPATFGDRVTVYVDYGGLVEGSMSIQGVVEGPIDGVPSDQGSCWTFLVAFAVDRPSPQALMSGARMDHVMDGLGLPQAWVTATGGAVSDDGAPMEYDVDQSFFCYSGIPWSSDTTDPFPSSEIGTTLMHAYLPTHQLPVTMTILDDAGRELHFDFDHEGCLANERRTRDIGYSLGADHGCSDVIDRNDQAEVGEWAERNFDYETW